MQTNEQLMLKELSEELTEEVKAVKRAYEKQWRANNKDKVRAKNQRYWLKKAIALRTVKEEANNNDN